MAVWHIVGVSPQVDDSGGYAACPVLQFLHAKGLSSSAEGIMEASGFETLEDLALVDETMATEIISKAGLTLIAGKKFRNAIAEVQSESSLSAKKLKMSAGLEPTPVPPMHLHECVAICIDRSGSMRSEFNEVTLNVVKGETKSSIARRTRMEAVKAMFYAFRDRVESLGGCGSHQIGLIQFDNHIEQMLDLTSQLDRFESIVDDVHPRGQTAIYTSIVEAAKMLRSQFDPESNVDLRVLVLTDGQSNTGIGPEEALREVNQIGAVVDAIIVGDSPDANLRKIVTASQGECYQINTLGEGFELLESESVVSLRARRGGTDKPPFTVRDMADFNAVIQKEITAAGAVQRTPVLPPDLATKAVVPAANISDGSAASSVSPGAAKRILQEIKAVAARSDNISTSSSDGIHIFPAPDCISFWRALIKGPQGSPFEGGVFMLSVLIPDDYPFKPPRIVFETPIYHCNVSDSGKICHSILMQGWNPAVTILKALEAVRAMLMNPNTDDALRQWIAELTIAHQKSNGTDNRYFEQAQDSIRIHAACTVEQWKEKWGCAAGGQRTENPP
jgi:ubiquitin-protein ligase